MVPRKSKKKYPSNRGPSTSNAVGDLSLKVALERLEPYIGPILTKLGLELVSARLSGAGGRQTMTFVIDKPLGIDKLTMAPSDKASPFSYESGGDLNNKVIRESSEIIGSRPQAFSGSLVTLNDCSLFSRAVSRLLDQLYPEEAPPYNLEVSSPGLDRPLNGAKDFERFNGFLAKITLEGPEGSRRYTGRLDTTKTPYKLNTDRGQIAFDLESVISARLKPEF
jgi:ribosome maturation factor RimP